MIDRNGACEFLQHGINVNSCLVRTGVQSNTLTLTVPCGSTFRPVCNLIQGIHELFYNNAFCQSTLFNDDIK